MAKNALAICLLFLVASSVIYEVQGTFLLKMYLRRKLFPRRCGDFTPFACKGMLSLMATLQGGCPATRQFKTFFLLFRSYIKFILSVTASSKSVDTEMSTKCEGLAKAMALLSGGVEASSDFKDTMFSMGKVLIQQKMSGSIIMRRAQRRELVVSMVKWTRMVVTLVTAASEKNGKSIDVSSLGLDVDVNSSVGSGDDDSDDDESPSSGSPSPQTETPSSGSPSTENESPSSSGSASSSRSGSSSRAASGSTSKDTSGGSSGSPSDSTPTPSVPSTPSGSSPSDSGETAEQGTASGGGESSTKTKQSSTGSTKSKNVESEATGSTSGSPTDSTSPSVPTPSVPSESGETSAKGTASGSGEGSTKTKSEGTESGSGESSTKTKSEGTSTSSETTSVKEVESETSKEVMTFISSLEQKYAGKAELKVFFDKLKSSMSASSKLSATDSKDFISGMKSAAGKLYQAMSFVRSKFSKSEEMKTEMETCQAQFMKTLKELQDIKSQIVSQSQGKTVTSTQQTELKQTITKWEQVTTQFVETAASSSSSSSQSQQSSSTTNAQAS